MPIEIKIDRVDASGRNYLTWAPVRGTLKRTGGGSQPVTVRVSNRNTAEGGQLVFGRDRAKPLTPTLDVPLPDGTEVEFWVAGSRASVNDQDAVLSVGEPGKQADGSKAVMVRIRKDANTLTPAERDRFTTAFAKVNDKVNGVFHNFRDMHQGPEAIDQAHNYSAFLAWHRAYLLDLERELQKKDPSVALPYWHFDRPAPNVFNENFMGRSTVFGNVVFAPSNLLFNWQTDGQVGIKRKPAFNQATGIPGVLDQVATLAVGGGSFDNGGGKGTNIPMGGFRQLEINAHSGAHNRCGGLDVGGFLTNLGQAPRDPMFFLLHCNVDRLWALWQRMFGRFDGNQANTYFYRGSVKSNPHTWEGHNLQDTLWPWNGVTGGVRPPTAPRPAFAPVPTAPGPRAMPTVADMIDYQGFLNPRLDTNFAYDDVAYGVAS